MENENRETIVEYSIYKQQSFLRITGVKKSAVKQLVDYSTSFEALKQEFDNMKSDMPVIDKEEMNLNGQYERYSLVMNVYDENDTIIHSEDCAEFYV